MKKLMTGLLVAGVLSSSAFAQNAADTTKEINAQTTITKGHIDNLIAKINDKRVDSNFRASDYWAQNADFKNSIDKAMVEFERVFEKEILPQAAFWMNQYNTVLNSSTFSPDQKEAILKERRINIQNQFKALSAKYKEAISTVYRLIPNIDAGQITYVPAQEVFEGKKNFTRVSKVYVDNKLLTEIKFTSKKQKDRNTLFTFEVEGGKTYSQEGDAGAISWREYKYTVNYGHQYSWYYADIMTKLYQTVIFPGVRGKCQSSICVGLRSSDQSTLLVLIKKLIDRQIVMKLGDGTALTLDSLDKDITKISELISKVNYPVELPFDI